MDANKYIGFILTLAIGVLLGFFGNSYCNKPITVKTTDTVFDVFYSPNWHIDTLKPKTIIRKEYVKNYDTLIIKDTVHIKGEILYISKPYTALLDTVCGNDSLYLKYRFPENIFTDIKMNHKPITIPVQVNNTTSPASSWLNYAIPAVGFVFGVYTGVKIK